jgi:PRC-barrel domain
MSYNAAGDNLGAIHDLMIDKPSGKVAYAIMSFGGFLGMGNQYHPLPWSVLKYDTNLGGYVVNLDKPQLEGASAYDVGDEPAWAIALTKVRYTTITGLGLIGLCNRSASQSPVKNPESPDF